MKQGRWYVIEVAYFEGNPIHKSIAKCVNDDPIMVDIIQHDGKERTTVDRLLHFKVVTEIEEMRSAYDRRGSL
jgi:hypothetical protein